MMTNSRLRRGMRSVRVGLCVLGMTLLFGPMSLLAQDQGPMEPAPTRVNPTVPVDSLSAPPLAFSLRYGSCQRRTASSDPWLARDKAKHVVGSVLWTLSTQYVIVNKAGWAEREGLPVSIASGVTIGAMKEVYDASRMEGQASVRDLVADIVGVGVAVGIIAL